MSRRLSFTALSLCLALALGCGGDSIWGSKPLRKIAFVSTRDDIYGEIYVMDTDGINVTNLTNNAADDLYPSYAGK